MRLAVRLHLASGRANGIPVIGRALGQAIYRFSKIVTSSDIDPRARLHPTVHIPHATGVVIGETAVVGERTIIMPGVVIGARSWDEHDRHAKIGARVIIGAGAVLLGPIKIGDGARIGANAVVLSDVDPGAVVIAPPARPLVRESPQSRGISRSQTEESEWPSRRDRSFG